MNIINFVLQSKDIRCLNFDFLDCPLIACTIFIPYTWHCHLFLRKIFILPTSCYIHSVSILFYSSAGCLFDGVVYAKGDVIPIAGTNTRLTCQGLNVYTEQL